MSDFFDNLDKSIEVSKNKKSEKDKIYKKIIEEHFSLQKKIFKNDLLDDFKKLENIFKKNKNLDIDPRLLENGCVLKVSKDFRDPSHSSIEIKLLLGSNYPSSFENLNNFIISKDNFYLLVEDLGDWEDDAPFPMRIVNSEKKFLLKDKHSCYEYFNKLFKERILNL